MQKVTGTTRTLLTEGMGGRMKRRGGQLVSLKKRITPQAQKKRTTRIATRRTVAEQIIGSQNRMAAVLNHFFSRGFFGRVKWLAMGR